MDDQTTSAPTTPEVVTTPTPEVATAPEAPNPPAVKDEEKPESKSTGPKNIAWDKVLNDYCSPNEDGRYPSLAELAKKYDVNETTVMERSSKENWVAKRGETLVKAEQMALEKKAKDISDANTRHLKKWRAIQDIANEYLTDFNKKLVQYNSAQKKIEDLENNNLDNSGSSNIANFPTIVAELKKVRKPGVANLQIITNILRTAIEGERIVLGLPIIVSKDLNDNKPIDIPDEVVKEVDKLFNLNYGKSDSPATQ